jgi:hypothetical protein
MEFSFTPTRNNLPQPADDPNLLPTAAAPEAAAPGDTLKKSAQNLLVHIPGEASGLYLMGVDAIDQLNGATAVFIAVLALVVLILVRWAANVSRAVLFTSIIAFLLWMFVLDKGVFNILFPNVFPSTLGLIAAVFYSTVVTILGNAGKIK